MNPMINGGRQPSRGGTSRMMREYHVRICEGLGVKFPGSTREKSREMGNERAYDRVSWAEGSVRTCWEARGYQSPGGASAQRDGCSYRLQSHRLGGQPLGSICRLSEAASLYVEAGAVQFACRQMDLGAGRIICSRPRGAIQGLDQDRPRPAEEWRNPVDLP